MKTLAPEIFRQRLLIEGYWSIDVTGPQVVRNYLLGLAAHLDLRTYGDPVVFSPASGNGRPGNAGYDAFVPLIDSGISGYFWVRQRFLSVVLYTCKGFSEESAIAYTRSFFRVDGDMVTHGF